MLYVQHSLKKKKLHKVLQYYPCIIWAIYAVKNSYAVKFVKHKKKQWQRKKTEVDECMEDDQPLRFKALLQKVPYQVKSLKQRHEITSEIQNIKALLSQIKEKNDRYKFKEQGSSSNTKGVIWHDP